MSKQQTLPGMSESTSLVGLVAGNMLSRSLAGQARSGLDHAHASRSARRGSARARRITGTSGLRCSGSLESAALTQSLASRLQEALPHNGSMEFSQTWKERVTPAGRRYLAHTASPRRTSDGDFTGWPTATANPDNKSVEAHLAMKERMGGGRKEITDLQVMAKFSAYPTPLSSDARGSAGFGKNELPNIARGTTLSQSDSRTGKPGALNPELSRWLMGFPREWSSYADTATPSSRKSRPRS